MIVKSLTEIKKSLNISFSTAKIYIFLEEKKIVAKKERRSAKDPTVTKTYWEIIDDTYGYNLSQRFSEATVPKFFEDPIKKLLEESFKIKLDIKNIK
jgi:hypothetical protein